MSMGKRRGRGEGSIECRNGKYRAVLSLGKNPQTGKRQKRYVHGPSKARVLEMLRETQRKLGRGRAADPGKETVGGWLARWLELRRGKIDADSLVNLETEVRKRLAPGLGPVPLGNLTTLAIEEFYATLKPAEARRAGKVLRAALKAAVRLGLLDSNPAADAKLPKPGRPEIHPLTPEQSRALLATTATNALGPMYAVALDAGMRQGELWGLMPDCLDLDAGAVVVKRSLGGRDGRLKDVKTAYSRRRVRLHPQTVETLRRHVERLKADGRWAPGRPVFQTARGLWIRRTNHHARFREFLKKAGLPPIRFHDLRHTCATLLLLKGVNVKAVSRRLGHSSVAITLDIYAHCLPEMEDQILSAVGGLFYADSPPAVPSVTVNGPICWTK